MPHTPSVTSQEEAPIEIYWSPNSEQLLENLEEALQDHTQGTSWNSPEELIRWEAGVRFVLFFMRKQKELFEEQQRGE